MKDLKRFGTMTLLLLLAVACNAGTLLAKGKPVHGGNSNQELRAIFVFPDWTSPSLIGDGLEPDRVADPGIDFTTYADDPGGVEAYFMGSGNPKLELGDPGRKLEITFEDDQGATCLVPDQTFHANGDALWFSGLAESEDGLVTIEDRFLGMDTVGEVGYSKLILRFIDRDESNGKDYLWRVIFGDAVGDDGEEASRVQVQRTAVHPDDSEDQWRVLGLVEEEGEFFSIAHVTRVNTKGKSVLDDKGFCRAKIDFDIELVTP